MFFDLLVSSCGYAVLYRFTVVSLLDLLVSYSAVLYFGFVVNAIAFGKKTICKWKPSFKGWLAYICTTMTWLKNQAKKFENFKFVDSVFGGIFLIKCTHAIDVILHFFIKRASRIDEWKSGLRIWIFWLSIFSLWFEKNQIGNHTHFNILILA